MKYCSPLLAVKNIEVSKKFYQEVLNQKLISDFGINVTFEGPFALQQDYNWLLSIPKEEILTKSKNFELYFEVEDLDNVFENLKQNPEIQFVHDIKEYDWGQRVIRIYDPDWHIIEIGEDMIFVIKRYLQQGLSPEEISKRTMYPLELVKKCIE